jgi:hypothetical protein
VSYKLFSRYKELLKLQEIVKKDFDLHLRLPPKHFWSDQKSKTIESRKFHIEDFLKSVLECEKIYYNGQKVLEFLGLPPDFYQKDKVSEKNREESLKWIFSEKHEVYLLFIFINKKTKKYPRKNILNYKNRVYNIIRKISYKKIDMNFFLIRNNNQFNGIK